MLARLVDRVEEALAAALLVAMTAVTFAQVVARYVFNSGAVWALELTVFLFAWLVLIGASHLVKTNGHLGISAIVTLFPTARQRQFGLAACAACLVYAGLLLWGAIDYVTRLHSIGIHAHDLGVPKWIPLLALPLGLGLLLLRFAQAALAILRGDRLGLTDETGHAPRSPGPGGDLPPASTTDRK